MRTTEGHIRVEIVIKIFNIRECTSNDDSSHRMSYKADSSGRTELNSFKKVI